MGSRYNHQRFSEPIILPCQCMAFPPGLCLILVLQFFGLDGYQIYCKIPLAQLRAKAIFIPTNCTFGEHIVELALTPTTRVVLRDNFIGVVPFLFLPISNPQVAALAWHRLSASINLLLSVVHVMISAQDHRLSARQRNFCSGRYKCLFRNGV